MVGARLYSLDRVCCVKCSPHGGSALANHRSLAKVVMSLTVVKWLEEHLGVQIISRDALAIMLMGQNLGHRKLFRLLIDSIYDEPANGPGALL